MHTGEEDHAQPGWTTSGRGQDSPWKSQSAWWRTVINRKVRSWCGQPLDRVRLKNRTEQVTIVLKMHRCWARDIGQTDRDITRRTHGMVAAEYCDERVCLSVCLSVCGSVYTRTYLRNRTSKLYLILCVLHMAVARSCFGGIAVTLCTSSFVNDVMFPIHVFL